MIHSVSPYNLNYKSSVVRRQNSFLADKNARPDQKPQYNRADLILGFIGIIGFTALSEILLAKYLKYQNSKDKLGMGPLVSAKDLEKVDVQLIDVVPDNVSRSAKNAAKAAIRQVK